ncbi:WD repeat-containing protein 93 [Boleophthalmus pectinirostris]|uniref:WD repeat-containing protein 93 n=1 Tax=Boleophthalmus pectinirostris TaxID=150288 RepID=UPI00242D411E|nr:WD repeat-containing protein 93 [Boleophthalmus pectinirostris]
MSVCCVIIDQLPENATCLALSEDGQYLSVGHPRGLSLWCASSFRCVAEWSQDMIEITAIQITKVAENTYLLGTVDDMGVARILIFWSEIIQLLRIINIMEDISNRSICITLQVSQGGDYGIASMSCNGAVWLEIFYFPTESWLRELGFAISQKKDSISPILSEVQWSPVAVINKIKPLHCVMDTISESPSQFDSHCLALDGKCSVARACTVHFLLPLSGERKENTDLPNALCMWWSDSKHLLQYSLQKATKSKSDFHCLPGLLWPNANKIVCSAVSECTRYIALGLSDTIVCLWDRNFGSPVSVLSMYDVDSAFFGIHFVDYCPVSVDDSKLHLLVKCKSGELYTVIIIGRGRELRMLQLTERAKDNADLSIVTAAVPFLQDLTLVIQRNGKMYLQDVINKTNVCSLILPANHTLATSCNPVFALNSQHHSLLIQVVKEPLSTEDGNNQLYIFRFGECEIVKPCIITPSDSNEQNTCHFVTLNDLCNQHLQDSSLVVKPSQSFSEVNGEEAIDDRVKTSIPQAKYKEDMSQRQRHFPLQVIRKKPIPQAQQVVWSPANNE